MTEPQKRRDDPDSDNSHERRADPTEFRFGWNGKSIQARGLGVTIVVVVLALVTVAWYFADVTARAHNKLITNQDRTSCIVAMTITERETFRRDYRPGAFKQWCPWMDE